MPLIYSVKIWVCAEVDPQQEAVELALESIISKCPYATNISILNMAIGFYDFQSSLYSYLSNEHTMISPKKYSNFMATASNTPLSERFNSIKLSGPNILSPQLNRILPTSFKNINFM